MLREWRTAVEHAEFKDFNHIREMFNSADYVPPYTVFDIGGNNYRLVVVVNMKLAQRDPVPLSLGERAGERETGMTSFIIRGGAIAMPVRYRFKKVFVHQVMTHREYDNWNKLYRKGKV